jgi:6-phospho-3-hexuloisomerase
MHYPFILDKIKEITEKVSDKEFLDFVDCVKKAPRVYIIGAGRSGLVAKAFGMRLVHLKKKVFIVGETITPAMRKGDLLIAVSGSGKTTSVVEVSKASKGLGGKVAGITSNRDSELASLSDRIVLIPSEIIPREVASYDLRNIMGVPLPPMGSLFEISVLIFFEACVLELMKLLGIEEEEMKKIHANI